jgi:hypothetical protein
MPLVAYIDDARDKLRFAVQSGAAWEAETLPDNQRAGWFPSIALSQAGDIYVSYFAYDRQRINLFYRKSYGGSWQAGPSISNVIPASTTLAFDAQDRLHVAFLDVKDGWVKHAVLANGAWELKSIARAYPPARRLSGEGKNVAMAVGPDGVVHLAFYPEVRRLTYIAIANGTAGAPEIPESGSRNGQFPSLALDASGAPSISYYDPDLKCLKLARRTGGSWSTRVIDDSSDTGSYSSIKVDSRGAVHISYYDTTNESLKYARLAGGAPEIAFVDRGQVGKWSSLALDSSGLPRISYYDEGRQKLKYAWAQVK